MIQSSLLVLVLFALISTGVSLFINALLLKFSTNLGVRNAADLVRWSSQFKPSVGGISFFILFLISLVFGLIYTPDLPSNIPLLGFSAAVGLGFLIGLADDAYNTKPILKFSGQVACGLLLIASGITIDLFPQKGFDEALTLLWTVGIMNSVNMLDNMDGITASTSLSITASLALMHLVIPDAPMHVFFVLLLGVSAALAGFLYYNWNPSRMFMGDTGSQFLGAFLAGMSVIYLWNGQWLPDTPGAFTQEPLRAFLLVWLFFLVPIADTTTVSVNRLMKGKSPFVGGRDHTTHHLVYLGLKDRHVASLLLLISLVGAMLAIWFVLPAPQLNLWHLIIGFGLCFLSLIGLYSTTWLAKAPEPNK